MTQTRAVVLHSPHDLRVETVSTPAPGPGEVLLEMQAVGICGSDIHYWTHGRIGDFIVTSPLVLGHESSGVVVSLGANVAHLAVGDRVAVEPGVACRLCTVCKSGRYNLCADVSFCATPPTHGSMQTYYVHAADFCYKLPEAVSFEEGALLEPLAVAVHACRRGGVGTGDVVFVSGAGTIGLVNMLVAKACGATKVAVSDVEPHRLAVAKKLGADYVFNGKDYAGEREMAKGIREAMGEAPNVCIDCTGVEQCLKTAIYTAREGGCVVVVGVGQPILTLPILDAAMREVDIRGVFRYANCYPTAISLIASGKIDVKPLITHRFTLESATEAFATAKEMRDNAIKVIVHCSKTAAGV